MQMARMSLLCGGGGGGGVVCVCVGDTEALLSYLIDTITLRSLNITFCATENFKCEKLKKII